MKAVGLIVEYNPFHNGHLYHLNKSKELSGADSAICIMSGNFIQRGEPAVINKWARAKMALMAGADIVIELPVVYAMSSAEYFADASVKILDSLGVVESICFGSESGDIDGLDMIADVLIREPGEYKNYLKQALDGGISYPAARQTAVGKFMSGINGNVEEILSHSNNILGIEYIKALKRIKSSIRPLTVKRVANSYNQEDLTGGISSATAIRKSILKNDNSYLEVLGTVLPESSMKIIEEEFSSGRGPVFPESFENIMLAELRNMPLNRLRQLPYVGEGLENRIKRAAENSGSMEELIDNICTRRYTRTRIQRCIFSVITGLTASDFKEFNLKGGPQYARVLGFSSKGRELLSTIRRTSRIPLIVKPADYKNSCNPLVSRMLQIEARSTDIYVLGYGNREFRKAGQEYTQNIMRVL